MAYNCFGRPGALLRCLTRAIQISSRNEIRTIQDCCTNARKFSSNALTEMNLRRVHRIGIKQFFKVEFYPLYSLIGNRVRFLSTREFTKSVRENRAHFGFSQRHNATAMYVISIVILVCGGSYAAVPLYRLYCQASGYGGTVKVKEIGEEIENMEKQKKRPLTVKFNADKSANMQWIFKPRQNEIKIYPGETALAFFTASNPTEQPITGVSTYNVIPFEAGQYFNKIQCFCFEEQRLNPGEEVDMPVFFYIDPEFVNDPSLRKVTELTLSYTFFEAKDGSWPDLGVPLQPIRHGSYGK